MTNRKGGFHIRLHSRKTAQKSGFSIFYCSGRFLNRPYGVENFIPYNKMAKL
jgi:hypothetical protein